MNKSQLIDKIAKDANLSKKDAEAALKATLGAIEGALIENDKVVLVGFGTFKTKKLAARKGRNPSTGDSIKIAASTIPSFKPGKTLKEKVNAKKSKKKK
ncbi:MAG: HU family DNA-binding protein [Saccharofermentans sp.]|nr:HU family DNA-binding protein [Saccharofermentans sp.]